jgi:hypothetical protein
VHHERKEGKRRHARYTFTFVKGSSCTALGGYPPPDSTKNNPCEKTAFKTKDEKHLLRERKVVVQLSGSFVESDDPNEACIQRLCAGKNADLTPAEVWWSIGHQEFSPYRSTVNLLEPDLNCAYAQPGEIPLQASIGLRTKMVSSGRKKSL